ncbi:ABC transporter permease subunit [Cryptosporangium aurantiacum]|uniref:ABC-2 type transport system permease protein n=1 Tax=Cryptosporangium aurantiacum TaxID=134849 RepID=A0A1M7R7E5_9ACTN|nr:ABC transporter permease subunit [Cryptosporangium aurantiacum]SHN42183.1 ABC-2 type transport system permease protein [Cryptosporangium aurantiacum]
MTTGVIHDLGYQRYTGPRLGRGYAFRTLYAHTVRTAFGLGRGVKAKIFSWSMIGLIGGVGVVVTAIEAQTGEEVMTGPQFVDNMSTLIILLLAAVAPELTSRDQQTRALGLYLARPMRRSDYALARLTGALTTLWLVLAGPLTLMFAGTALSTKDGARGVADAAGDWAAGLAHAATVVLVLTSISLLIASLIKRRAVAAAAVVAVFLVTLPAVGISEELSNSQGVNELVSMVSPPTALSYLSTWLYADGQWEYSDAHVVHGPWLLVYTVAVIAACAALLVARYRKVPA